MFDKQRRLSRFEKLGDKSFYFLLTIGQRHPEFGFQILANALHRNLFHVGVY
jgi:hypothetical protein